MRSLPSGVRGPVLRPPCSRTWTRARMTGCLQDPPKKALGRGRIPLRGRPEVDRGAGGIDRAVEVLLVTHHSNVSFVYSLGTVGRFQFPPAPLIEFWRIPLYPTPSGRMVSPQTSLREKFFDVTIGERIPQKPTHRAKNDGWFEVSPFEWCRSWFAHWHQPTRPTCQICNTSHHRSRRSKDKESPVLAAEGIAPGRHQDRIRCLPASRVKCSLTRFSRRARFWFNSWMRLL